MGEAGFDKLFPKSVDGLSEGGELLIGIGIAVSCWELAEMFPVKIDTISILFEKINTHADEGVYLFWQDGLF